MRYIKITKICVILAILLFVSWKCFVFMEQNSCLDSGNVWDYRENRCREDCLVWNEINGCIRLTEEQIELFRKCRYKPVGCIKQEVFNNICLYNNLPLNTKTGECNTEFTPDMCYKLGEHWIYPKMCGEEN